MDDNGDRDDLPLAGRRRVLIVQYAGDYRAIFERMHRTGEETYFGHRYVLSELERFSRTFGDVGILCCRSGTSYSQRLPNGVLAMGAAAHPERQKRRVVRLMAEFDPTHVVILGPMPGLIRWALRRRIRVMCVMADSFERGALRLLLRYGRLAHLLNDERVEWVANHNINACMSLEALGVRSAKLIPWDWPHERDPEAIPTKTLDSTKAPTIVYAGSVIRQKGVGDAIDALAILRSRGQEYQLIVAGEGAVDDFREQARRRGVHELVTFLGAISNTGVWNLMQDATAVVIPSRHSFPEGLPLTIYEALAARTPIIASDHPMFRGVLVADNSALVVPAGDPTALAEQMLRLHSSPDLYARLSRDAPKYWRKIQRPVKWGELIFRWIRDSEDDEAWLKSHSFEATGPELPN